MLTTCLTCKTNKNLVRLDEPDIHILDYLFHPHSTPYLDQLKGNEATQICTACRENIRGIDKFRKPALENFLQLMQLWQIEPSLKTGTVQSIAKQQDVMVGIQSPSLDSTVVVKTEPLDLLTEELIIKPDVDEGHSDEEPESDVSKMMLDNILQGMYVAKTSPTSTTATEATTVSNPSTQLGQLDRDDKSDVTTISQPTTDIVQWSNTSSANKTVHGNKKASMAHSKSYVKSQYRDDPHLKRKCRACRITLNINVKKVTQPFTMWELARRPPPANHEFYPRVVALVHKHFTDGWKNWVVNDIPYEDLFGTTIDTQLEKNMQFLLPSVELIRAWDPQATKVSVQKIRNIKRRLLKWSFGRTLLYAPKVLCMQIHDSCVFVDEVWKRLKPLILSRKALLVALKREVLEGRKEDVKVLEGKEEDVKVLEGREEDGKVLEGRKEDVRVLEGREEDGKVLEGREEDVREDLEGREEDRKVLEGREKDVKVLEGREEDVKVLKGSEEDVKVLEVKEEDVRVLEGREKDVKVLEGRMEDVREDLEGREEDVKVLEGREKDVKVLEGREKDVKVLEVKEEDVRVLEGREKDVKVLEGRMEDVREDLEGREEDVKVLEGREKDVKVLEGRMEDVREDLEGREEDVKVLEGREKDVKVLEGREEDVKVLEVKEEDVRVLEGREKYLKILEGRMDVCEVPSTSGLKRVGESLEQVKRMRSSDCEEL